MRKSVEKIQVSLKPDMKNRRFTWRQIHICYHISLKSSHNENVLDKIFEKIEIHILCSITFFFRKSYRLWDNVEEFWTAGQITDDNIAHAHCVMDNQGYNHTLTGCNTSCFSTTTMVVRMHLNVRLYAHYLSCFWLFFFRGRIRFHVFSLLRDKKEATCAWVCYGWI